MDPGGIIDALGLKQKLTPSRNNGFLNMFRLMQQKAAQLSGKVHACRHAKQTVELTVDTPVQHPPPVLYMYRRR